MAAPSFSFDGTFTCGTALRRLLDRCPALASSRAIASLSREVEELELRGDAGVVDRAASALAQPFLHPDYTIPVVGCFRPICRGIVERAVDLLRRVRPPLSPNGGGSDWEDIGEGEVEVVEFYISRRCGLKLHELACFALCRALDLVPGLLRSVLKYFDFSPPPFQRLAATDSILLLIQKDDDYLLNIVRLSLRFLQLEPDLFSKFWDWSCFLDLVQNSANSRVGDIMLLFTSNVTDIRWCAIQVISIILRISDTATRDFGLEAAEALQCMLRWEEFCQDTALEKASWYIPMVDTGAEGFADGMLHSACFQFPTLTDCQGKKGASSHSSLDSPFVLTNAVKKAFEIVLVAVSQKWPILLYGPSGSGKTALIRKLANMYKNQVLFIHMDEQMDSKTLIGSYVCSEQPGEFRWQAGTLTQAIMNGFWVVFEDIDKSPMEVQPILLPLLEGSSSFVTVHGEAVNVAESFRLFATVSSSLPDFHLTAEGRSSLSSLWRKVMVGAASNDDLLEIIIAWHPCLKSLSSQLADTLACVNRLSSFRGRGHSCEDSSDGISGQFSTRHVLKLCKRVMGLRIDLPGCSLSVSDCESIYQEAVDIFASAFSNSGDRLAMMQEIAMIWRLPYHEIERSCLLNKPAIQDLHLDLQVGRVTLHCTKKVAYCPSRPFVNLRSSLNILEKIACSVKYNEPVLLVGETGTGKTTLVQNLAMRLGQPLIVLNLSQQSDASDLLGGFKPSDTRSICIPLYREFLELFQRTFSVQGNEELLRRCNCYKDKEDWKKLLGALGKCVKSTLNIFSRSKDLGCGSKRKRSEELPKLWECFSLKLESVRKQISNSAHMSFSFVEGAFVMALRNGSWILLDEVNLAPQETLQRIIGVVDGESGTLCLAEKGDVDYVTRHPCFRIFCCMNPATDAGKRDLPHSFRSRFTEYYVNDMLDDGDLCLFVSQYIDEMCTNTEILKRIVQFYKMAKSSEDRLQDGANQKPHFSLRSLARALEYTKKAEKRFGIQRALHDGFSMFFVNLLDGPSAIVMRGMIESCLLGGMIPLSVEFDVYLDNFCESSSMGNYVLTASVKEQLRNLARAVYIKRYPVLLQGPTSSGKTSLVQYLASLSGHKFVRINNHEHTDLQEYFGSYITNTYGRLEFQEGVLVEAVRKGYWVVLDELNLAPSDVLEALNRLLDDNRELFVPELQEAIAAHPDFMLFATQNPPTLYAGRKMLSRAFRNRFLEIHVDEIPENELAEILEKRCKIPLSYAKKMVEVMKDLQLYRQKSKVFSGKHGFITPRDLFRWANRFRMFGTSYMDLAKDGYFLLAERLREESEKVVVQEILERCLRVKLSTQDLYKDPSDSFAKLQICGEALGITGNITMTQSMQRLYFLVERCYKLREPVLLVGETGGGKTTVCQLLSAFLGSRLNILNCHQYTEASDFIGGFHPVRDRSSLANEYRSQIKKTRCLKVLLHYPVENEISSDIGEASSTINFLRGILVQHKEQKSHSDITQHDLDNLQLVIDMLSQLQLKWQTIFLWEDGPLVQAMKNGNLFLVDEISLADDSVLERLNSVLEPERTLLLAERGGSNLEEVIAHQDFFILATMNPGGDYGKKELSPALRNRFTEIWVPSVTVVEELRLIASERFLTLELRYFVEPAIKFLEWFNNMEVGRMLTVRDLLSWISFVNETQENLGPINAFLHGVFLILLDGLSLGTTLSKNDVGKLREKCLSYLLEQLKLVCGIGLVRSNLSDMKLYGWGTGENDADNPYYSFVRQHNMFGIHPFCISKGGRDCKEGGFEFMAPTTCRNVLRLLRAMQLRRPVLLEGSPGVGKTSLVVALAEFSGHHVVRINLSEQTDMMDLLGSDLPVAGNNGMEFAWSDGVLLQALKDGSWVLLDELNLAPQSVLEGLNAILDHRAEVYIPELGSSFKCPPSFRIFACQNPTSQGGGRKGLPKSFLNRFTKVYVDELVADDYLFICRSLHPLVPEQLLLKLIKFNTCLYEDTMLLHKYGQEGSPWEFNLRDIIRACQIIEGAPEKIRDTSFLSTVYIQRMRTATDRNEVLRLYEEVFGKKALINQIPRIQINSKFLSVGEVSVPRNYFQPTKVLRRQLNILPGVLQCLEAVLQCVQHQWLCILVGPSSSGKSSVLQLVAQLVGSSLHELNLSSGTDVSELLGCFEQYNAFTSFTCIFRQVENYMSDYCALRLESSWESLLSERKSLISRWLTLLATTKDGSFMPNHYFATMWKDEDCSYLSLLVEIIEQLKLDLKKYDLPVSWSDVDLTESLNAILNIQKKIGSSSTNFEWVNGCLLKAIECGEWVVLDNANLCNPTVLDRINSLVEPNGFITVNERGLVDGSPVMLRAHPNFRLFITIDPKYGEISRAMRNRGVEIFMMEQNSLLDEETSHGFRERESVDVKRFLVNSGIPLCSVIEMMTAAHMYAKHAGLQIGVRITLLELKRWVQLFQKLLMGGNHPRWSLKLSWEHTYLTSLGETEGRNIVVHVVNSYLAEYKWSSWMGNSLCLPGGWPLPLDLTKFVWFSQESTVKCKCMYVEFLGAQCAAYEFIVGNRKSSLLNKKDKFRPIMCPVSLLCESLFPGSSGLQNSLCAEPLDADFEMNKKMLFFACNWVVEQATGNDLELFVVWLKWYTLQLHPYSNFLKSFSAILDQELSHPIWNFILQSWRETSLHHQMNVNQQFIPLLSDEMTHAFGPRTTPDAYSNRLHNSIRCVGYLRLSLEQWNAEKGYVDSAEGFHQIMIPVLKSLRQLEEEVLGVITESNLFDHLLHMYSNLLEQHRSVWRHIISSDSKNCAMAWQFLLKDALKLREFFPVATNNFLEQSQDLIGKSPWNFHIVKPWLWMHGGHPYAPTSAEIFHKKSQILNLCSVIWSRKNLQVLSVKDSHSTVDAVLSTNIELRYLAMQGICMSTFIMQTIHGNKDIINRLEEIYQGLLRRTEHERSNLRTVCLPHLGSSNLSLLRAPSRTCCDFDPEIICGMLGFNSWLECLPLFDRNSIVLDLQLLQELTITSFLDSGELSEGISRISKVVQYALDFSLKHSSRSPNNFAPHQKILWILDAWTSLDSVFMRITNAIHEMWFHWHSSLWYPCSELSMIQNLHEVNNDEACLLISPIRFEVLEQILRGTHPISGYDVYNLKIRVTSRNFFQDAPSDRDVTQYLLTAARSLFQQIIFAHKKSFEEAKFHEIKTLLYHLSENKNNLLCLEGLILSSSHSGLTSCMDSFIRPLIKELSRDCVEECVPDLGLTWLQLGLLRFHILLKSCNADPSMKYSFRLSQIAERISMLKLEIKVRQECELLAGKPSLRGGQDERTCLLNKLEEEKKKLEGMVVFRPNPADFENLKIYCYGFLGPDSKFPCNLLSISEIKNWQAKSMQFIHQLSEKYAAYVDVIQPLQVAVYEMKLGLTLIESNLLENEYLLKVDENRGMVLATIYSFMQFPRRLMFYADLKSNSEVSSDAYASDRCLAVSLNVLKKLIATQSCLNEKICSQHLEASIHHSILNNVAHSVGTSMIMDESSFSLINDIFIHFTTLWFRMKSQVKLNKDITDQAFKFRARAVRVEDILTVDLPSLSDAGSDENYKSEEMKDPSLEGKNLEEEWNLIPEDILKGILNVHDQIFAPNTLSKYGAIFEIAEKEKLQSFVRSYDIGAYIIKGLPRMLSTTLDEKLMVEQMLRVCLEAEGNLPWFQQAHTFNIYKDPNASVMSKMVESLIIIQERVKYFLTEWLDHPLLENILGVIETLLSISLDTPLFKALFSLESLLVRAQTLQETCPKFSLSDHLEPIYSLVHSWQKIELDSWHTLLPGVEEQYVVNAGKLWFPLHSVLHCNLSGNFELDAKFTMERVKEFMETSSLGEFKKRLQLLVAFHGQFNTGISMNVYLSTHQKETLSILYNALGYYVQFLPLVMKHISAERSCKEEEIKNQIKLLKWERPNTFLSIMQFRVARHKLWKLIQKFNIFLQQPLMAFIDQEANIKNSRAFAWFKENPSIEADKEAMPFPVEPTPYGATERLLSQNSWKLRTNLAFESSSTELASSLNSPLLNKWEGCWTSASKGWTSIEKIYRHASDFANIWKHGVKNLKKRRSLTDLLKLLEASGLSRHRSLIAEIEARSVQLSTLLCQPSYDVHHLLLEDGDSQGEYLNYPRTSSSAESDLIWNTANRYYFKNIAMFQQLWQAHLNFHKDLSLEQANRAISFIDHLITMQMDQRSTLYALWEQLRKLKRHLHSLNCLDASELSLASDQHLLFKCMLDQKKLFDELVNLSKDASLFLQCTGNSHFKACHNVRVESETVTTFIAKHLQLFMKSKELLDKHLFHACRITTASVVLTTPLLISKQMEVFIAENFQVLHSFDDALQNLRNSKAFDRSMVGLLLDHFTELIVEGKHIEKEFLTSLAPKLCTIDSCQAYNLSKRTSEVDPSFTKNSDGTIKMVKSTIHKLILLCDEQASTEDMSQEKITSWNFIFEKFLKELQLGAVCVSLCETITSAGKLLGHCVNKDLEVCTKVESQLKHLYTLLGLFSSILEAVIFDFLAVHNAISEMTNILAQIFALLFSEGFGDSKEQVDDISPTPQDATGTGMGEGEGINDVSNQIDDEDQLLGTSEKPNQGQECSEKAPSKSDKGIEMDEDFAADAFSVSEDSGDDEASESEDVNLESVMDENVDGSHVVDEKLWDKEEETKPEKNIEKYELGSSVKDTNQNDREFRGKEDASNDINESEELADGHAESKAENENQNASEDEESADVKMDETNAFEDSSGVQCSEQKQECEEADVDEAEDLALDEEVDVTMEDANNLPSSTEDHMDFEESGEADMNDNGEVDETNAENTDVDNTGTINEPTDLEKFEPKFDSGFEKGSIEHVGDSFAVDFNLMPETHLTSGNNLQKSLVSSDGLPNVLRSELLLPDSVHGQMFASDKPIIQSVEDDSLPLQRPAANPYRSIGDALEEWKDRVKISEDSKENQSDMPDNVDDSGDEYQFISETEKGSSQTLGPATSDQINQGADRKDPSVDDHLNNVDTAKPMDIIKEESREQYIKRCETSMHRHNTNDQTVTEIPETGEKIEDHLKETQLNSLDCSGNIISFESSFIGEEPLQSSEVLVDAPDRREVGNVYDAVECDTLVEWKRYERITTRLSQELCEQLRLVMEPTLASKLQGDYKTGKRINMKKVIPYIASHYRKDKIWLRRTRPNKRDYRVVVAIDDSRSMSEGHCGSFAIEALITICRAMSQLEVGQFAVTSFGEQGNIKLLHEFGQPFTGETGSKIISSLSFKQDNTIRDEPVADLLKYVDNMLDTAVSRARLPSGVNPLKQLILIIADGRFQDKEKLRHRVRDILNKKRMIAFVLLDNPQESIIELPEYSFVGGKFSCTNYMVSFPFPFYVVLRDIEALPRTVADLLRQWFQLTQSE